MIKVISGHLKGMKIQTPQGETTRPTSARIRESIFSALGESVVGSNFVDLFAGSGAIGIEAISRGAASCIFVEKDPKVIKLIEVNLTEASRRFTAQDLEPYKSQVLCADSYQVARRCLERKGETILWADPPYDQVLAFIESPFCQEIQELCAKDTLLVIEMAAKGTESGSYCQNIGNFICIRNKTLGQTRTVIWKKEG